MPFVMHGFTFKLSDGQEINMSAQEFPEHGEEYKAVEEIINEELDVIYHERISINMGVCPVCYTELSEENSDLEEGLTETVYYCPHCGYESDAYYG
jgi:transposase-like protein